MVTFNSSIVGFVTCNAIQPGKYHHGHHADEAHHVHHCVRGSKLFKKQRMKSITAAIMSARRPACIFRLSNCRSHMEQW